MAVYYEILLNVLQPMADKYTKKGGAWECLIFLN